ncbi:MAG: YcxB family protein [Synergistaceae bacterium]|nr:YcxB family protein [Synergistaceae bacterium]
MGKNLICSASIDYTPENLRELNKTINNTFKLTRKFIYVGVCIALLSAGAMRGLNDTFGLALVCVGCFLFPSLRAVENARLNTLIKQLNGRIVRVEYSFYDDVFECWDGKQRSEFRYSSIIRTVKRRGNFFMFPNEDQAYMIDLSSLTNISTEKFIDFIDKKTGMKDQSIPHS